jgi:hypothetical protein
MNDAKNPVPPTGPRQDRLGSNVRLMNTAQTIGDVNSCHAEHGNPTTKTPGRVMAP